MSLPLDPSELFRELRAADVAYVVIGGFAVIAHGVPRTTADLDICPDPDPSNLARLAGFLRDIDARQAGEFDREEFPFDPTDAQQLAEGGNFRLETRLGDLDIMQWVDGVEARPAYDVLAGAAIEGEVFGVPVRVCSLEHLRAMKLASNRDRDRADLADLRAIHGEDPPE